MTTYPTRARYYCLWWRVSAANVWLDLGVWDLGGLDLGGLDLGVLNLGVLDLRILDLGVLDLRALDVEFEIWSLGN